MKRDNDQQASVKNLLRRVDEAFADLPVPPLGALLLAGCDDLESDELRAKFGGRHWKDLTQEDLVGEADAMSFFTPLAYQFFLPAFISFVVLDPERADLICDVVLWMLVPYDERFLSASREVLAERGIALGLPQEMMRESCRSPDPAIYADAFSRRSILTAKQKEAVLSFVCFLREYRPEDYSSRYLDAVEAALLDGGFAASPEAPRT